MSQTVRVAITGLSVFCPIGCEHSVILGALREGRSGIGPVTRYPTHHLQSKLGGEVPDVQLSSESLLSDRTAQMAVAAARQAWRDASIETSYAPQRVGLCVGASGAGLTHGPEDDVFALRFQPHEQATAVSCALGISGPVVMFTCASAGSGLALVQAMNLLRDGRCDAVVAGGAECLSQVNHESMDAMRLCSDGPCSPFSGEAGLTVGEGSAFFVLERLEDAVVRNARVHAELFSFGVTQDAYDIVAGDPSGEGQVHAFAAALKLAAEAPGVVDWIKANGTSNRDQDAAETISIKRIFQPAPPVAALESFVGHANGAAPAIGLGLALVAFENGLLPPTLNFLKPRAGCDLDYVPNYARASKSSCVLANSVGFGGSNVALLFGTPRAARLSNQPEPGLCITGVGVVSPFGEGFNCFIEGLRTRASAIRPALQWQKGSGGHLFAGLAQTPKTRGFSNKLTLLQRFALAAATEALASSGLGSEQCEAGRVGLFVGLCRGSAVARAEYAAALSNPHARKSMGRFVVRMGRFTVASALSQHFKLKGYGATISEGFGTGLHALAHACIHLENSEAEQALLVIAADEIGPGTARSLAEKNWLATGHDGCYLRPYDPQSQGTTLGEGAVALVVERTKSAQGRRASIKARIPGVGLSASQRECALTAAIRQALERSHFTANDIAGAYGNGSGIWPQDEAEMSALRQVLPLPTPIGCVNSGLGFAESASGLFHAAAAIHGLNADEFFPIRDRLSGSFPRQLLTARTEGRRNAAVVLSR